MSKREREDEKKLKEDPESVLLQALKEKDLDRARKILCERTQAILDTTGVRAVKAKAEDWTNLLLGAFLGYVDYVNVLIQNGAGVNAVGKDKYSPLHRAAQNGQADVVKVLIQSGADVNAVGKYKNTERFTYQLRMGMLTL